MICARSAELSGAQAAVVYLAHDESGESRAAAWHGVGGLEPDRTTLPVVMPDSVLAPALTDHRTVRIAAEAGVDHEAPGCPGCGIARCSPCR